MVKLVTNTVYNFLKSNSPRKEGFNGGSSGSDMNNLSPGDTLLYFLILVIILFLFAYVFQMFWNNYLSEKTNFKQLSYSESFIMYFMFNILF